MGRRELELECRVHPYDPTAQEAEVGRSHTGGHFELYSLSSFEGQWPISLHCSTNWTQESSGIVYSHNQMGTTSPF